MTHLKHFCHEKLTQTDQKDFFSLLKGSGTEYDIIKLESQCVEFIADDIMKPGKKIVSEKDTIVA